MPTETTREQMAREALSRQPLPESAFIRVSADGIRIVAGFSEALHRLLRWVPKAEWRPAERSWHVPFSGAEALRAVLPEVTRLAEAARDLDDPPAELRLRNLPAEESDLLACIEEAATLLHGADWRAALLRENRAGPVPDWLAGGSVPTPDTPLFDTLSAELRRKAAVMIRAADRLDARRGTKPSDGRNP